MVDDIDMKVEIDMNEHEIIKKCPKQHRLKECSELPSDYKHIFDSIGCDNCKR